MLCWTWVLLGSDLMTMTTIENSQRSEIVKEVKSCVTSWRFACGNVLLGCLTKICVTDIAWSVLPLAMVSGNTALLRTEFQILLWRWNNLTLYICLYFHLRFLLDDYLLQAAHRGNHHTRKFQGLCGHTTVSEPASSSHGWYRPYSFLNIKMN